MTPEDKAFFSGEINRLNDAQNNDRRGVWRAPEMSNIMKANASQAFVDNMNSPAFKKIITDAVKAAGGDVDPVKLSQALNQAFLVPGTLDPLAGAVLDAMAKRLVV